MHGWGPACSGSGSGRCLAVRGHGMQDWQRCTVQHSGPPFRWSQSCCNYGYGRTRLVLLFAWKTLAVCLLGNFNDGPMQCIWGRCLMRGFARDMC